ncbi:MAG: pantoate--beta-alanine ligase [Candidatus Sumerlaeota bacterium]|nr:pantoate--beta-alanine ligase [Candidatus Sumerlaeota bacterium]
MDIVSDPAVMQRAALEARRLGRRIALVPTMGNLHEGHLALIREARRRADLLAVSIFVNPTQFGPNEDLGRYPRTPEADLAACRREGVDWVFTPSAESMYGIQAAVWVEVEGLGKKLCGRSRPIHFRGVATVVLKLFNVCQPHVAVFGWKDAQQFLLLRRMVEGLNVPVEMVGVETVREPDGLALSSRNRYLAPEERKQAVELSRALREAQAAAESGRATTGAELVEIVRKRIERVASARIDYVEAVSMRDLEPIGAIEPGATLLALAAFFGTTRLIDNARL